LKNQSSVKKVVSLDVIRNIDEAMVGVKAMSLCRMSRIGLKVPPFFCIRAIAFREHLEANGIIGRIESVLDKLHSVSAKDRISILSGIRQIIIDAPLAAELCKQIEKRYRILGAECVAVRSSATAEDLPGHSFAGQYETYLGITDLSGCIEAIKKCWASLWTERAYEYREKNGFDHLKVNMAVIVQSLVEADTSGVIFTTDPVTGSSSRIIVEACFGLGDSLVSGKVTPDRFIVRKRNLKILSHRVSEKTLENEQACVPCIDKRIAKKLAKLAKRVETKFNYPQDIEWAIRDNKIFFLQARPIATVTPKKSWEERQVWTNLNIGEALPDVLTPITWSMVQLLLDNMVRALSGLINIELAGNPLYGQIAGRAYFNINTGIGMFRYLLPGLLDDDYGLNDIWGGDQGRMHEIGRLNMQEEDIPDLKFRLVKTIFKLPISVWRLFSHNLTRGELFVVKMRTKNRQLQALDIGSMSEAELGERMTFLIGDGSKFGDAILYILTGLFAISALYKVCNKWLGEKDNTLANNLLMAGMSEMASVQAGLDIWCLSAKVREFPEVEEVIVSSENWQTVREKIVGVPGGDQFLHNWGEFMVEHGHHCYGEMELFNPRWCETPNYILFLVRGYITGGDEINPIEKRHGRAQQRKQLVQQSRDRLINPIKRFIFNYFLDRAMRGAVLRENWKSEGVRCMMLFRRSLMELGQRLNNRGVLENQDDIFFLKLEEIDPVAQNKADFDFKKIIVQRRAEYEKNKSVTPPKVVIGKFDPDNFVSDTIDTDAEVLTGLAVSPGVVTGKARVILRADNDEQVLPGEILVAPFTDPGWTPCFVPAAAIVMDQGGLLSHGSIIAREYGRLSRSMPTAAWSEYFDRLPIQFVCHRV
jgi:pyruvate,water dikinase